jgi:hypothetical protein
MRENWKLGYRVADPVVCRLRGGRTQVLLIRRLQNLIRGITGLSHGKVPMIHRLGEDDRRQTVPVGGVIGVSRLKWRHG